MAGQVGFEATCRWTSVVAPVTATSAAATAINTLRRVRTIARCRIVSGVVVYARRTLGTLSGRGNRKRCSVLDKRGTRLGPRPKTCLPFHLAAAALGKSVTRSSADCDLQPKSGLSAELLPARG